VEATLHTKPCSSGGPNAAHPHGNRPRAQRGSKAHWDRYKFMPGG